MTTQIRPGRTNRRPVRARQTRLLRTAVLGAAALGLGATGCATASSTQSAPTETTTVQPTTAATPSAEPNELRYVSSTAAPCSSVWVYGAILPPTYEWCVGEDGQPVAGVRIGSCEVIAYRNEMYAVPGRAVVAAMGPLQLDAQFLASLTSCKRRPAPGAPARQTY